MLRSYIRQSSKRRGDKLITVRNRWTEPQNPLASRRTSHFQQSFTSLYHAQDILGRKDYNQQLLKRACLSTSPLQEAIKKIQQKSSADTAGQSHTHSSTSDTSTEIPNSQGTESNNSNKTIFSTDARSKLTSFLQSFSVALSDTWTELVSSSQPKDINKKLYTPTSHPTAPSPNNTDSSSTHLESSSSPYAIMVIDPSENLTAFERIQRRLSETPILKRLYDESIHLYEKSGLSKAQEQIHRVSEDAKEAWETSQNPWVYRISSVYDTITSENEFTATERELRILDPDFSLVQWKEDVVEYTLPKLMKKFLQGKVDELQSSLGEAVFHRLSAEAKVRNQEGVYVDSNILGIMNSEILTCHPDQKDGSSPIIVLHFMVQQINCVRKKDELKTIVEGAEDDIRAYSYIAAFQREYDETKQELKWKIVDFMLNGAIAYL